MAGTVRKRTRRKRNGEVATTWFADYYDQNRERHRKTFAAKQEADAWLDNTRVEVRAFTPRMPTASPSSRPPICG